MISDILSDALAQIEEYQKIPGAYLESREEIEAVKLAMRRLLIRLDTPPGMTHEMWVEGMLEVTATNPLRLSDMIDIQLYQIKKDQVAEALGQGHPLLAQLREAERRAGIS